MGRFSRLASTVLRPSRFLLPSHPPYNNLLLRLEFAVPCPVLMPDARCHRSVWPLRRIERSVGPSDPMIASNRTSWLTRGRAASIFPFTLIV